MPVEVKRTIEIKKSTGGTIVVTTPGDKLEKREVIVQANGETIVLDENAKVEKVETVVKITCDSPRCAARHGADAPTVIEFTEEKVANDPTALPDGFAGLLKLGINPYNPDERVFCSPRCNKDFLDYAYVTPKSPRQIAQELAEKNAAVTAEPIATPEAYTVFQTEAAPGEAVTMPKHAGQHVEVTLRPAVSQADGDPGDVHEASND